MQLVTIRSDGTTVRVIQDSMVVDSTVQITMSVLSLRMNVTRMQTVQIRMEATTALATMDTTVMALHAQVSTQLIVYTDSYSWLYIHGEGFPSVFHFPA